MIGEIRLRYCAPAGFAHRAPSPGGTGPAAARVIGVGQVRDVRGMTKEQAMPRRAPARRGAP